MHFLFIVLFTGGVSNGRVFWTKVRGDRRGKGFGAEQLLGLAGSEVTERIDWVGGWSEPGAFKTATGVNTAAINSSVCDND
jgi:hypothetical protein